MSNATSRFTALILLSGEDAPGTVNKLLQALAPFSISILESDLLRIRERAVYSLLIELNPDHQGAISADLEELATLSGLDIAYEFSAFTSRTRPEKAFVVNALSQNFSIKQMAAVAATIARIGGDITHLRTSSFNNYLGLEIHFLGGCDIDLVAFTREFVTDGLSLYIRPESKKGPGADLLLLDMDSTFINEEVIDLLAEIVGVGDQVARITKQAMKGEIDFEQALAERVALLKGLPIDAFAKVRAKMSFTEGAQLLVKTIKSHGGYVGIVSGGFHEVIDEFLAPLQLDLIVANNFEIESGVLTGKTLGPVVDAVRKAQVLKEFAASKSVEIHHTIAIGDGSNDVLMIEQAGIGIAFCAQPALRERSDVVIDVRDLTAVLTLLGYSEKSLVF